MLLVDILEEKLAELLSSYSVECYWGHLEERCNVAFTYCSVSGRIPCVPL